MAERDAPEHLARLAPGAPAPSRYVPFSPPFIGDEEIAEVVDTLRSDWITTGPKTAALRGGVRRSSSRRRRRWRVSSCTAALHVALAALGIGPGDAVLTTTMTFCSTVNVIEHVGARPVLVDVEPDTLNLDPGGRVRATPLTAPRRAGDHAGPLRRPPLRDGRTSLDARRGATTSPWSRTPPTRCPAVATAGAPIGGHGAIRRPCLQLLRHQEPDHRRGRHAHRRRRARSTRARMLSLHGMSRDAWKRYERRRLAGSTRSSRRASSTT